MTTKKRLVVLLVAGAFAVIGSFSTAEAAKPAAKQPAQAATELTVSSGSGFLAQCGGDTTRPAGCLDFVAGLYEGIVSVQNNLLMQKLPSAEENRTLNGDDKRAARDTFLALSKRYAAFCPPTGVMPYTRAHDLLLGFIRENPQYQDMSTGDLFIAALAKAYPCGTPEAPGKDRSEQPPAK